MYFPAETPNAQIMHIPRLETIPKSGRVLIRLICIINESTIINAVITPTNNFFINISLYFILVITATLSSLSKSTKVLTIASFSSGFAFSIKSVT